MKLPNWALIAGFAVLGWMFLSKSKKNTALKPVGTADLLSSLAGQQVTLGNGNVMDTSNGVVYDPLTGAYTNVFTGV